MRAKIVWHLPPLVVFAIGCSGVGDDGLDFDAGASVDAGRDAARAIEDGGADSGAAIANPIADRMPPGGWQVPACDLGFHGAWTTIDVTQHGVLPNTGDVTAAITALVDGLDGPTILSFPEGTYGINDLTLRRDDLILRGAGAKATEFRITTGSRGILWSGKEIGSPVPVTADVAPGGRIVPVSEVAAFEVGDVVMVVENLEVFSFPAAERGRGGVFRITSIDAGSSTITLDLPLALGLDEVSTKAATVTRLDAVERVGIEAVRMVHEGGEGNMLHFQRVSEGFIRAVETRQPTKHHVALSRSRRVAVCHSWFFEAQDKGTGGNGYGVLLDELTTGALVSDNILKDVRHQIAVQVGSNYNVVSYNLTVDSVRDACLADAPPAACGGAAWIKSEAENGITNGVLESDIVVHGNFPHHNLFEGNVAYNAVLDHVHETNGPGHLFYRNTFRGQPPDYGDWLEGVGFWIDGESDGQTVVGNDFLHGSTISLEVRRGVREAMDVFIAGNRLGAVEWSPLPEQTPLPPSLYLDAPPEYWPADLSWPPFGPDVKELGRIPAQLRYEQMGN